MELLQVRTKNDINGNSRILWVAIEGGAVVDGETHHYNVPNRFRQMMHLPVYVAPTEWKRWKAIVEAVRERMFLESGPLPGV